MHDGLQFRNFSFSFAPVIWFRQQMIRTWPTLPVSERRKGLWERIMLNLPGVRDIGTHVHYFGKVNPGCYFLVQPRRMLKPEEENKMLMEWMSDPRICHLFKWKEATTGNFCMVNCLVLSWCELHLLHLDFIEETQSIKAFILNTLAALEPGVDILNYQPDLGHWAQMFSLSEPVQAEVQGDGGAVSNCWQVKRNVPKRIDCCRNTLTHLHVKLIEENMEIFCKTWQTTSDWSLPVNIVSTIQVQEEGTMPGGLILKFDENILDNLFCRWDACAADPEWQWKTHGHPDIIIKRLTKDYEKEVKKYPMNDEFFFLPY